MILPLDCYHASCENLRFQLLCHDLLRGEARSDEICAYFLDIVLTDLNKAAFVGVVGTTTPYSIVAQGRDELLHI